MMGVDWTYIGELPKLITSPSSSDEESKGKLELALEMLKLAHFWVVTELHERLQEFIVNAPDFINPYWVKQSKSLDSRFVQCWLQLVVREHAELVEADELLSACEGYEEKNQMIIKDVETEVCDA